MPVYLHDIPLEVAQQRFTEALQEAGLWGILGSEEIPLDENAVGRVLFAPVWAKISSPHYHASAMDGFAVRAEATAGAQPGHPVSLAAVDGDDPGFAYVDTGDPLPEWADAVIPIENVEPLDQLGQPGPDPRRPAVIRIRAAVTPWSHVRPIGEDIVATQLVLPSGHVLRPVDLGAVAACGHAALRVARRPRVAILPTGTELVPIGQSVSPGDIIEYNSLVMAAQVGQWGGQAVRYPIIPDQFDQIHQRVLEAAQTADLVLLNAGSSAGSEDYSANIVEMSGRLLVHGVAVRPGHPVILGMIATQGEVPETASSPGEMLRWTPIIGVPGYPVSAALTAEIFIEPLLAQWLGRKPHEPEEVRAVMARKVVSPAGDDDFMRVAVGKVGQQLVAAPLSRGSGVITSLVRADGLTIIPRGVQGLQSGSEVKVRLYRSRHEIERTIFAIGSHDICLDLVSQHLAARDRRLASANVGSLGGLVALQRGESHLAGSHLLDPETGGYNLSYIQKYLAGIPVKVLAFVGRQQGLLVRRGNPRGIRQLADLARGEVVFVNRQRGAGTRVLLDYELGRLGLGGEQVRGYEHEEYTHLSVAALIASGKADCGLGIAAAAQALDLDFIPLFQEDYQLVIPAIFYNSELMVPLLELLEDPGFHQEVERLPGYDVSRMGSVIYDLN